MQCTENLGNVPVFVDLSPLQPAGIASSELMLGLALGAVGLLWTLFATTAGHRRWSLLGLLVLAFVWTQGVPKYTYSLPLQCLAPPTAAAAALIHIGRAVCAAAIGQLFLVLLLGVWQRKLRHTIFILAVLVASAGLTWRDWTSRRAQVEDFVRRMNQVSGVPNIIPPEDPDGHSLLMPRAHVGLAALYWPQMGTAGGSSDTFSRGMAAAWGVDKVMLTPTRTGPQTLWFHRTLDLVSFDFKLPVVGVADTSPSWFPIAIGNRFEFISTMPEGLNATTARLRKSKGALPPPTVTMEVVRTFDQNGFHTFELLITPAKGEPTKVNLIRGDGRLHERVYHPALGIDESHCLLPGLGKGCICARDHIRWCVETEGGHELLRFAFGVATMGLTEVVGPLKNLPRSHESWGLLATQWRIDGVTKTIRDQ